MKCTVGVTFLLLPGLAEDPARSDGWLLNHWQQIRSPVAPGEWWAEMAAINSNVLSCACILYTVMLHVTTNCSVSVPKSIDEYMYSHVPASNNHGQNCARQTDRQTDAHTVTHTPI